MKKFFSAILLMTAMVFSVSTFVSCNDLTEEMEAVTGQAGENADAINALKSQIATLEQGLTAANAAIADAKSEAAKAVATAKAEAIAEAKTNAEKLVNDLANGKVADLEKALATLKGTVEGIDSKLSTLQGSVTEQGKLIEEQAKLISAIDTQVKALQKFQETAEADIAAIKAAIADLEDLRKKITANTDAIEAVKTELTKIQGQIKAISDALVVVNSILSDLANQVQSLTFVPEFWKSEQKYNSSSEEHYTTTDVDNSVYAYRAYLYGNSTETGVADLDADPIVLRATYEVSPKKAVENIKNENLYFSTAVLKGEEPVIFKAEILERDVTTGRMVVVGYVPEDYKNLNKTVVALNISEETVADKIYNVEDAEGMFETINAGTSISSGYNLVKSTWFAVNSSFVFKYQDEEEGTVYRDEYKNYITMPYKTAIADSKRNLFEIEDVMVNFEGNYLTLDQVKTIFGVDCSKFKANDGTVSYNAGTGKKSPVKVTGKTLTATAELQKSDDYKGAKAVNQKAELTVNSFSIGDYAVYGLSAFAQYKVGYESAADIKIQAYNAGPWSYTYFMENMENVCYQKPNKELAVEEAKIDLTTITTSGGSATPYINLYADEVEYKVGDETKTYTPYARLKVLSSKAVRLEEFSGADFRDEKMTYTLKGKVYDKNKYEYNVSLDITVGEKPANKEIKLGEITYKGFLSQTNDVPVGAAFTKVLTEEYDAKYYEDLFDFCEEEEFPVAAALLQMNMLLASFEPVEEGLVANLDDEGEEASIIRVKPLSKYNAEYTLNEKVNLFGIEYTFTGLVKFEQPKYTLKTVDALVKDGGIVELGGQVTLPGLVNGVFTSSRFALNQTNLRQYVEVEGLPEEELGEVELLYSLKNRTGKNNDEIPTGISLSENWNVVAKKSATSTTSAATDVVNTLTWNNTELTPLVFDIELRSTKNVGDSRVSFGKVTVTLTVPEFLTFKGDEFKVNYVSAVENSANIVDALSVMDKKTGKVALYNDWAKNLNEFFMPIKAGKPNVTDYDNATGTYAVYGQKVKIVEKEIKAYLAGTNTPVPAQYYTVDTKATTEAGDPSETYGKVTLDADDVLITGDIIVEVPVELTHWYCATPHKESAKIRFVRK